MVKHTQRIIRAFLLGFLCLVVFVLLQSANRVPTPVTPPDILLLKRLGEYLRHLVVRRPEQTEGHHNWTSKFSRLEWRISLEKVAQEMEERRRQIHRVCQEVDHKDAMTSLPRALVSVSNAVVYCPVEKAASTFFRRFLYQLDHTYPMRSPFEVPVKMIYACRNLFTTAQKYAKRLENKKKRHEARQARRRKKLKQNQTLNISDSPLETIDHFLQTSTNFLFVRDPYWRLFSAYVDKLLAPNPDYWSMWGTQAIQKFRAKPSEIALRCGHNVTFQEFLSFVLDLYSQNIAEPHLQPIHDLCEPCSINYTVIGQMNTFQRDAIYLSSLLNISESQLEFDKMAADAARDAIEDSVTNVFRDWSPRIAKCMSKQEATQRIWRKLQIRGFINTQLPFPLDLDPAMAEDMEAEDYINLLMKSSKAWKDANESSLQRQQAFIDAYKNVSTEILTGIAKIFAKDFRLFGFDEKPREIFDRSA